jgi:hypothetical protein
LSDLSVSIDEMRAIEAFTIKLTVPVLYDDQDQTDQIGTGTLFSLDGRTFLVTARHLFDGKELSNFAIPDRTTSKLRTLGSFNTFCASDESIDVAILELLDKDFVAELRQSWSMLSLENTSIASKQGIFLLCGYPSERNTRDREAIRGQLIHVFSERISETPSSASAPVRPDVDLFFTHHLHARDVDGQTIRTTNLRGTSGAPVWEYRRKPSTTMFWTPESSLKIVGVQVSAKHDEFFRAVNWALVLQILRQVDKQLESVVASFESEHK